MSNRILVTGGSGYLASWIIVELLRRGYSPVATVRGAAKAAKVRAAVEAGGQDPERVGFVEADLLQETGWDAAVAGVEAVVHTASPMRGDDIITPARRGTSLVLRAARAHGVPRIVLTSSLDAAVATDATSVADENTWTDLTVEGISNYRRAKTLAESDAWAFATEHPEIGLTTVLPGFMQGPVLAGEATGSVELVARLLNGKLPGLPRIGFPFVDVRDVAALHVDALAAPRAAGHRYLTGGHFLWLSDVADVLRREVPELSGKLPRRRLPDLVVRAGGLVNPEVRDLAHLLGRRSRYSAALAVTELGWKSRPVEQTLADTARSLAAATLRRAA